MQYKVFEDDQTCRNTINCELGTLTRNKIAMMKALSDNKNMVKISLSNKYIVVKSLINRGFV